MLKGTMEPSHVLTVAFFFKELVAGWMDRGNQGRKKRARKPLLQDVLLSILLYEHFLHWKKHMSSTIVKLKQL